MIKINLLPQKRAKMRVASADGATQHLAFGIGALVLAGAAVFLLVDRPKRSRLSELETANAQLDTEIAAKRQQLVGYAELKKASDEADERFKSIRRLLSAKVVPAHLLQELGEILTTNKYPTMTEDMAKRTGTGPESDPNKRFAPDWEASHIWLTSFSDNAGEFKLEGGAQSESDVTQLAKRLSASVYFANVTPAQSERVVEQQTGVNYYKFTITGTVAY